MRTQSHHMFGDILNKNVRLEGEETGANRLMDLEQMLQMQLNNYNAENPDRQTP